MVDLHYRSLVKLRQESQIPPPIWRGPSRRELSPTHPTDTRLHIQLPQKVTDSYKLVYISHPARGDSDSGEHSPADSQGVDFHPGPTLRKAHSLKHVDIEARRGPASREHSLVKHSGTKDLPGPAHSLKDLLVEVLTQGITQQQNLLEVLIVVVCQILQIKLKKLIVKAITHQGT